MNSGLRVVRAGWVQSQLSQTVGRKAFILGFPMSNVFFPHIQINAYQKLEYVLSRLKDFFVFNALCIN